MRAGGSQGPGCSPAARRCARLRPWYAAIRPSERVTRRPPPSALAHRRPVAAFRAVRGALGTPHVREPRPRTVSGCDGRGSPAGGCHATSSSWSAVRGPVSPPRRRRRRAAAPGDRLRCPERLVRDGGLARGVPRPVRPGGRPVVRDGPAAFGRWRSRGRFGRCGCQGPCAACRTLRRHPPPRTRGRHGSRLPVSGRRGRRPPAGQGPRRPPGTPRPVRPRMPPGGAGRSGPGNAARRPRGARPRTR
jgi:hypothetical protein